MPDGRRVQMGGVGLADGCLYGGMGAWRVVGAATAVWHGVTNRRSIEKCLGVMHMAWYFSRGYPISMLRRGDERGRFKRKPSKRFGSRHSGSRPFGTGAIFSELRKVPQV